jgi:hypothetical protein
MSAGIVVIDFYSVVSEVSKRDRGITGKAAPGLAEYVRAEQDKGSAIFFIAGNAHDPFWRQTIERYLEGIGVKSVFVTHGLPDGFTLFISSRALKFDGSFPYEHKPVSARA